MSAACSIRLGLSRGGLFEAIRNAFDCFAPITTASRRTMPTPLCPGRSVQRNFVTATPSPSCATLIRSSSFGVARR